MLHPLKMLQAAIISLPVLLLLSVPVVAVEKPWRILLVDSYHAEYRWSQSTHQGVLDTLQQANLLTTMQRSAFLANDTIETPMLVLERIWLDTKRHHSRSDLALSLDRAIQQIDMFKPDLLLLGDDHATRLLGNQYLDTELPIVFWGVNGSPMRYGLLDSMQRPGHNITGVYQSMYHLESIELLKKIIPSIRTIAVISDDSTTGRAHASLIKRLQQDGEWPTDITQYVLTNNYTEWKQALLRLSHSVDAFFILNHNALKDDNDLPVPQQVATRWYLKNIRLPEAAGLNIYVEQGLLCNVADAGEKQGSYAMSMGLKILKGEASASMLPVVSPPPGDKTINKMRLHQLELSIPALDMPIRWLEQQEALR